MEKQRWEEPERRIAEERRSEKRKSEKKEDADARKGRKVAKHCVFTKGSLGYLSSMYFSTSLVPGEVVGPFPEIER